MNKRLQIPGVVWREQVLEREDVDLRTTVTIGCELVRHPITSSAQRTFSSGWRAWGAFRGLIGEDVHTSVGGKRRESSAQVQALVASVAWCSSSEGNHAGAIAGKSAAVKYSHRVEARLEIPAGAPLVNRALKGVEKAHVAAGTYQEERTIACFLGNSADWSDLGAVVGGTGGVLCGSAWRSPIS